MCAGMSAAPWAPLPAALQPLPAPPAAAPRPLLQHPALPPRCRDELPEDVGDNPDAAAIQAILDETSPEEAAEGFKARAGLLQQHRRVVLRNGYGCNACGPRRPHSRSSGNRSLPPAVARLPHAQQCR